MNPNKYGERRIKTKKKGSITYFSSAIAERRRRGAEIKRRGPHIQWIRRRYAKGAYENICKELAAEDTSSITKFMRMTYKSFQTLVDIVSSKVVKKSTKMITIPVAQRVALTLRFLATGESFRSLYRIPVSH